MSPPPAVPKSRRAPTIPVEETGKGADKSVDGTNTDEENDDESGSGEPTIIVSKLRHESASVAAPPSPPPSRLERPESQNSVNEPQTPIQAGRVATETAPPSTKTKVRRVRTSAEVERVCVSLVLSSFGFNGVHIQWVYLGKNLEYNTRPAGSWEQLQLA